MKILFNNIYTRHDLKSNIAEKRKLPFSAQKSDAISFGMANLDKSGGFELNQIRADQKKLEANIRQRIVSIPDAILFLQDYSGTTQFMRALYDEKPNNAIKILDYVKNANFSLEEKKKFLGLKDEEGNTQFDVAIKTKYYGIAMKFLKLMVKIDPEKVVEMNIPEEIHKMINFPEIVDKMIENEALSKEKTLEFLDKNMNYVSLYAKRRALVEKYAENNITLPI